MRCLVTGATGFIGSHIIEKLVSQNCDVVCLVRKTSRVDHLKSLPVALVIGDITSPETLETAVDNIDLVIHSAAMVSDWGTPREICEHNVQGTRNLVQACTRQSIKKFIHISSTDVYGYPGDFEVTESTRPVPRFRNWYSFSKQEAENVVQNDLSAADIPYVIFRPATVYGRRSFTLVQEIAKAIRDQQMFLINQGKAVAGLCYIDDLVDLIWKGITKEGAINQAFNVCDGTRTTWKEFLDELANQLDYPRIRWNVPYSVAFCLGAGMELGYRWLRSATGLNSSALLSRQAVHLMGIHQSFSMSKAHDLLDFEPRFSLKEGIHLTKDWILGQNNGTHKN
ncbi:MAG: NAD(P)-dependent oxidoreductase [Verrucomicrobiota bacterium]